MNAYINQLKRNASPLPCIHYTEPIFKIDDHVYDINLHKEGKVVNIDRSDSDCPVYWVKFWHDTIAYKYNANILRLNKGGHVNLEPYFFTYNPISNSLQNKKNDQRLLKKLNGIAEFYRKSLFRDRDDTVTLITSITKNWGIYSKKYRKFKPTLVKIIKEHHQSIIDLDDLLNNKGNIKLSECIDVKILIKQGHYRHLAIYKCHNKEMGMHIFSGLKHNGIERDISFGIKDTEEFKFTTNIPPYKFYVGAKIQAPDKFIGIIKNIDIFNDTSYCYKLESVNDSNDIRIYIIPLRNNEFKLITDKKTTLMSKDTKDLTMNKIAFLLKKHGKAESKIFQEEFKDLQPVECLEADINPKDISQELAQKMIKARLKLPAAFKNLIKIAADDNFKPVEEATVVEEINSNNSDKQGNKPVEIEAAEVKEITVRSIADLIKSNADKKSWTPEQEQFYVNNRELIEDVIRMDTIDNKANDAASKKLKEDTERFMQNRIIKMLSKNKVLNEEQLKFYNSRKELIDNIVAIDRQAAHDARIEGIAEQLNQGLEVFGEDKAFYEKNKADIDAKVTLEPGVPKTETEDTKDRSIDDPSKKDIKPKDENKSNNDVNSSDKGVQPAKDDKSKNEAKNEQKQDVNANLRVPNKRIRKDKKNKKNPTAKKSPNQKNYKENPQNGKGPKPPKANKDNTKRLNKPNDFNTTKVKSANRKQKVEDNKRKKKNAFLLKAEIAIERQVTFKHGDANPPWQDIPLSFINEHSDAWGKDKTKEFVAMNRPKPPVGTYILVKDTFNDKTRYRPAQVVSEDKGEILLHLHCQANLAEELTINTSDSNIVWAPLDTVRFFKTKEWKRYNKIVPMKNIETGDIEHVGKSDVKVMIKKGWEHCRKYWKSLKDAGEPTKQMPPLSEKVGDEVNTWRDIVTKMGIIRKWDQWLITGAGDEYIIKRHPKKDNEITLASAKQMIKDDPKSKIVEEDDFPMEIETTKKNYNKKTGKPRKNAVINYWRKRMASHELLNQAIREEAMKEATQEVIPHGKTEPEKRFSLSKFIDLLTFKTTTINSAMANEQIAQKADKIEKAKEQSEKDKANANAKKTPDQKEVKEALIEAKKNNTNRPQEMGPENKKLVGDKQKLKQMLNQRVTEEPYDDKAREDLKNIDTKNNKPVNKDTKQKSKGNKQDNAKKSDAKAAA